MSVIISRNTQPHLLPSFGKIVSGVSSYFPIGGHSVTGTKIKIRKRTQGSNNTKMRLQNMKQIEPQQKYRLGTISNIRLPTSNHMPIYQI